VKQQSPHLISFMVLYIICYAHRDWECIGNLNFGSKYAGANMNDTKHHYLPFFIVVILTIFTLP
jgi:hypothetical protein